MAFELVAYEKLKQSVKESIKTLIEHHNPRSGIVDISKLEEHVKSLDGNPERRGIQAEFLLKVLKLTEAMGDESNRALLLNAAVYHIHQMINNSYKLRDADSSTFNFALKTSLGLTVSNMPNQDEQYGMYNALVDFLKAQVIQEVSGHVVYKEKHPFQIEGYTDDYDVADDIAFLTTKVHELMVARLTLAKTERDERARPGVASAGGLFGGWFGSASRKKVEGPAVVPTVTTTHSPS